MAAKKKVYAFDFDGTVTTADSFLRLIRSAKGRRRMWQGLLLHAPWIVLSMLRLYDNGRAKERVFSWFFKGMTVDEFNDKCEEMHDEEHMLVIPCAWKLMATRLTEGYDVVIVSASMPDWILPYFRTLKEQFPDRFTVIGTEKEVRDGVITGRFRTRNCYGAEKVRRRSGALSRQERNLVGRLRRQVGATKSCWLMLNERHYKTLGREQKLGRNRVVFAVVGTTAAAIQYGVYWVLLRHAGHNVSMTVAYFVSFCFNFVASTWFTFRVKATARRGAGFAPEPRRQLFHADPDAQPVYLPGHEQAVGGPADVRRLRAAQLPPGAVFPQGPAHRGGSAAE